MNTNRVLSLAREQRTALATALVIALAPALAAATPAHSAAPGAVQDSARDASTAGPDGPYVRRLESGAFECKRVVADDKGPRVEVERLEAENASFQLALPDVPEPFVVRLRAPASAPQCRLPAPERVFAFSDIEGELGAMLRLLRAGNVVDEQLRWTFGSGHVAYVGDLFDRGVHVTECLWVLYELEARAREAGGALHFVLGNHEVMNLTGDLRYVRRKYHENAALLGEKLEALYANDTVLGQWLRTRNAAVQLGSELFVHGGVSPKVGEAGLRIEQLNDALRTALAAERWSRSNDGVLALAAGSPDGLIWYRGYLKAPVVAENDLDKLLEQLQVERVVVGHTVVENVGFVLGGRVLALDVHHASGHSQAALREKGAWKRITPGATDVEL